MTLKTYDEDVHIKCRSVSNKPILDNLIYLDNCDKKTEIRIPFVPEYNDDQMEKIGKFLSKLHNVVKVRVLPYHNYADSKYKSLHMKNTLPEILPINEEIKSANEATKAYGLSVCD